VKFLLFELVQHFDCVIDGRMENRHRLFKIDYA